VHIEEFEGFLARLIQHECDHLDGVTYVQRMVLAGADMSKFMTFANYKHFILPTLSGKTN
jgi:peptide deformylase